MYRVTKIEAYFIQSQLQINGTAFALRNYLKTRIWKYTTEILNMNEQYEKARH